MEPKNVMKSKTSWFGGAVVVLGALEALNTLDYDMPDWAFLVIGLGIITLRSLTSVPVSGADLTRLLKRGDG